ncbi:unnamed protein product [Rangifer tarandus platyrhynchus]|uniref:Uncharacterized protein n=2 Tax=Rangifer tarandus platyrhynchus TaxID=3082113 RepID=A0AC59ZT01_RANTA|nr:unnamed protein product [Rangifer tarandus platyrhynchus]
MSQRKDSCKGQASRMDSMGLSRKTAEFSLDKEYVILDFPITSVLSGSGGKESSCSVGDPGSVPGLGRSPGEGKGNPLQYSCLGKSHGQRSLVGYSVWGCKESDTTEQRTLSHKLH